MNNASVLEYARTIARAIDQIRSRFLAFREGGHWIKDILVYGSTAQGSPEPNDLDIMVIVDPDWYNERVEFEIFPSDHPDSHACIIYGSPTNTKCLFETLMTDAGTLFTEGGVPLRVAREIGGLLNSVRLALEEEAIMVDTFFLPETFFSSEAVQQMVSEAQQDPDFFFNCFTRTLRWDPDQDNFVATVGPEYYQEKYSTAPVAC